MLELVHRIPNVATPFYLPIGASEGLGWPGSAPTENVRKVLSRQRSPVPPQAGSLPGPGPPSTPSLFSKPTPLLDSPHVTPGEAGP